MGKTETFDNKPKPPTKECILSDLSSAGENDVVFRTKFPAAEPLRVPSTHGKQGASSSHTQQADNDMEDSSHPDPAVVNFTYDQVTELISLQKQLSEEPSKLQEQYENLEKLGDEVAESIAELKQAAESVLHKAKKSKKK